MCGSLVDYVDPSNITEITQSIKRAILEEEYRKQREKNIAQASSVDNGKECSSSFKSTFTYLRAGFVFTFRFCRRPHSARQSKEKWKTYGVQFFGFGKYQNILSLFFMCKSAVSLDKTAAIVSIA